LIRHAGNRLVDGVFGEELDRETGILFDPSLGVLLNPLLGVPA